MVSVSAVPSGGNKESTARMFLDNCRGLLLTVYFSKSVSNILLKEEMLLVIAALTQPRRGVVVRSGGDRAWAAGVLQPRPHSVITPTPCAHLHLPWGLTQIRTYFNTYRINETFMVWDFHFLLASWICKRKYVNFKFFLCSNQWKFSDQWSTNQRFLVPQKSEKDKFNNNEKEKDKVY